MFTYKRKIQALNTYQVGTTVSQNVPYYIVLQNIKTYVQ